MNATMLAELEPAWHELDADPDVRVIVNTGNGDAFQTGLDVVELEPRPGRAARAVAPHASDAELRLTAWHNRVWKPVIAAVNGVCAGGGLHFVADADIVIAATDATFLDPHVSHRAGHRVRDDRARAEVADGGDHAHGAGRPPRADRRAARAYELGILSRGRRPARAASRPRPRSSRETIARNSPAAMRATKKALWGALELGSPTPAGRRSELIAMWGHPDQEEGPRAFVERREPRWLRSTAERRLTP